MTLRTRLLSLAALAAVLAACGSSSYKSSSTSAAAGAGTTAAPATTAASSSGGGAYGYASPASTTAAAAGAGSSVALATVGDFGSVLVDSKGMTLYLFEKDSDGKSACSAQCVTAWPPAVATGTPQAGDGVDASKLSTITRDDGTKQLAYNGHPLYTFAADSAPGQAGGEGINDLWYVVSAAGDKVDKS